MRWFLVCLALFAFSSAIKSQSLKQGSIWYLADHVGVDFKYNPPLILNEGIGTILEHRAATISDEDGNLLFYTDGITVWNKDKAIMLNGNDITSIVDVRPITSVIVPHPGDGQLYYIFVANAWSGSGPINEGLHYSIVDMSGDGGKGEVIQKRINLVTHVSKLLTVVSHPDGQSFWIISHGFNNSNFHAYLVSESGISAPVVSSVGNNFDYWAWQLKGSPDGTKLAVSFSGNVELFHFNGMNGMISEAGVLSGTAARGIEFSPDSELLYVGSAFENLFQFDVSDFYDFNSIIQSKLVVGKRTTSSEFADLQVAYNGKIYAGCGAGGYYSFSVVNNPNIKGAGCNYNGIGLLSYCTSLMPTAVQSFYRESPTIPAINGCALTQTKLVIHSAGYADSISWDFGDGSLLTTYPSLQGKNVSHVYDRPGIFPVKAYKYIGTISRELATVVTIRDAPKVDIGPDTILCRGEKISLSVDGGLTYKWSTGDITSSILVSNEDNYWVEVNDEFCAGTDTIQISVVDFPLISLGDDKVVCSEEAVTLSVTDIPSEFQVTWSTGDATSFIKVNKSGFYSVEVSNERCVSFDTINVTYAPIELSPLRNDTLFLYFGEIFTANGSGTNIDTWYWDFGDGETFTSAHSSITHYYNHTGNYSGHLMVSNFQGCNESWPFMVKIQPDLVIPNVITPNGDHKNDTFEIGHEDGQNVKINIFNRWGGLVFYDDHYNNDWNGGSLPSGTYYYKLSVGEKFYSGWLSILK